MITKAVYLLIALVAFNISVSAQRDKDVALTINGKQISKRDLQKEFKETQTISENGQGQSIDEFLKNYIFHALVLEEARSLRIDTMLTYRQELDSYKTQLVNSFVKDTVTENKLVAELLQRFEQEVQVNQVFIPFDSTLILPSDTIAVYQRALEGREIAIREGFDKAKSVHKSSSFGVVVDMETETGNLGWLRPFMFSYKLDEVLYSVKLNEVTMPIRTIKGYHVLQVTGRRPAQGNPVVEQVMFNFPIIPADQRMQDSIYNVAMKTYEEISLKDNFQEICNEFAIAYDRGEDGCLFGEVNMGGKIPANIIKTAFELKEQGEISKPILTDYGWHILRLKHINPRPSQEMVEATVKSHLKSEKIYPELLARRRIKMLKDYKGKINTKAYEKLYAITSKYNPRDKEFERNVTNEDEELINIDGKQSYSVQDFLDYIIATLWLFEQPKEPDPLMQSSFSPMVALSLSSDMLETQLNGFVYSALSKYEKESLGERNAKFSQIVDKLSDDLLFTKLMEQKVWIKSRTDAEGLKTLFEKNKENYTFKEDLFKGFIVFTRTQEVLSEIEKLANQQSEVLTAEQLKNKYNQGAIGVQIEEGIWAKGSNGYVDTKLNGTPKIKSSFRNFPFYTVFGRFISSPEELSDIRTQVEGDYQKQLDEEFAADLQNKYSVTINNAVINKIK